MIENIEFFFNNAFAISVAVFLLYERSKFNEKVAVTLDSVTKTLERIETNMRR